MEVEESTGRMWKLLNLVVHGLDVCLLRKDILEFVKKGGKDRGKKRVLECQKVVYYESRNREIKIRLMNEGRYDERLKTRVEKSTCLTYTGLNDKTN